MELKRNTDTGRIESWEDGKVISEVSAFGDEKIEIDSSPEAMERIKQMLADREARLLHL